MNDKENLISQLYHDIYSKLSNEDKTFLYVNSMGFCCKAKAFLRLIDNIVVIYCWDKKIECGWKVKFKLDIVNPNCDIVAKFLEVVNSADIIAATQYRYRR